MERNIGKRIKYAWELARHKCSIVSFSAIPSLCAEGVSQIDAVNEMLRVAQKVMFTPLPGNCLPPDYCPHSNDEFDDYVRSSLRSVCLNGQDVKVKVFDTTPISYNSPLTKIAVLSRQ